MAFFIGTITNALAQGPEMNKEYTVPMTITYNNSYLISGDYFLDGATSTVVTVSGFQWADLRKGAWSNDKYITASYGETKISYEFTGTEWNDAKSGNLYLNCNGDNSIVVTVLNKDGSYVGPTPTPGGGGGGTVDPVDPDYEPDYTNQLDENGDGVLEPCAEYPAFGALVDYKQYPQKTELPTIYLTTDNDFTWTAQTPKSEEYMSATIVIADKNGTIKQRNESVTFRGRGNSTWNCGSKKKPWRLKFSTKTALLTEQDANYQPVNNYADAKSWTLLANVYDKTLMRNAIANELGKAYGMEFCPAYRFVDLVVNGNYMGTYQISDHVQVDKKRVNVNSKTGWFVEFCTTNFVEDPYIVVNNIYTAIKNPETEVVTASGATTDPQYDAMKTWLSDMWAYLANGANGYDDNTRKAGFKAFRDKVDLKSLTGFMIIQDVAGNYDGGMANVYAYKEADADKLKFGPIWDLDIAFGNYSKLEGTHFWNAQSQGVGYLFGYMWQDPYFVKALYENWQTFYQNGKLADDILAKIDDIANLLTDSGSQVLNYNTAGDSWRNGDCGWNLGSQVSWCTQGVSSYTAAVTNLKEYISSRISWINETYKSQYDALGCANLDPCTDFGHNDGYVLQSNGTYKKGCDVCGTLDETDTQTYYQFLVYPESKKTQTVMATSWQPSAEKPNSIAVVEAKQSVVEKINGWNIIAGKKATFADGSTGLTCKDFRLTDGHPYYSENKFVATKATYSRSISNPIGTICLPYKMQLAENADAKFYHLKEVSSEEVVLTPINPEEEGNASAYVPVVFIANDAAMTKKTLTVTGENITVKKTSALEPNSTVEGWSMVGTMEKQVIDDVTTLVDELGNSQYLYYFSGGKFWRATGKYTNNPFRAYVLGDKNIFAGGTSNAKMLIKIDEGTTTSIVDVNKDKAEEKPLVISRLYIPLPEGEYRMGGRRVIITK